MSNENQILTPDVVAEKFIEAFDLYNKEGKLTGPVFSDDMTGNLLVGIRQDPASMVAFFVQTSWFIKTKIDEREGENSQESTNALTQYLSVMFGWFIRPLSACMRDNLEMTLALNGVLPLPVDTVVGIPEISPKDLFAGVDGLDFSNWIGEEPETPETTPPLDPSS